MIFIQAISKFVFNDVKCSMPMSHFFRLAEKKELKRLKFFLRTMQTWNNLTQNSFDHLRFNFVPKFVQINTCGNLYRFWKDTNKFYQKAPSDGLDFNVEFFDSKHFLIKSKEPVILALHGVPGSYRDFTSLVNHFYPLNARIIAPNFPDYSVTHKTKFFRHSTDEKTAYLKDFLSTIGVKNIDMVITHSSAVYPGLRLWIDNDGLNIKSFVFLNPSGHRRVRAMEPAWFVDSCVKMNLNPYGHQFFKLAGKLIFKLKNIAVKVEDVTHPILSATTMFFADIKKFPNYLTRLKENQTPLLFVFSRNDRLINTSIFLEMTEILGAESNHFTKFDKNKKCLQEAVSDHWMEIVEFESGGHYAFLKHSNIVNLKIEKLLNKVIAPETLIKKYFNRN